jgi:hypothetical protein
VVVVTLRLLRQQHTRILVALAASVGSVAIATTVWLRHDSGRPTIARPLDPATARSRILAAIDGRLDGGPLRLEANGGEGAAPRERLTGEVDLGAGFGKWTETTPTESGTDVIAETVVVDGVVYSRVYFAKESPSAFTKIADAARASQAIAGAVTVGGKLTDSLERVRSMVAEIPLRSFDIGTSDIAGEGAAGIRVEFQTGDVYDWLAATGLETVDGQRPTTGMVTMLFWSAADVLVGFGARHDGFHDGELLHDLDFDVTYRSIARADVSAPVS